MSQKKVLMEVTYHTDDDVGMYKIGEIDFGVATETLTDYLNKYGWEGRDQIINTLSYLIHSVWNLSEEKKEKNTAQIQNIDDKDLRVKF